MLPAYSRSYAALNRAGLITATDETENQELKNLVLRERAVVWADQGGSGNPLSSEKKGEGRHETGGTALELAPALSFSQLLYHSNSPCSKLSYRNPVFCINMFRCSQMFSYPDRKSQNQALQLSIFFCTNNFSIFWLKKQMAVSRSSNDFLLTFTYSLSGSSDCWVPSQRPFINSIVIM